MIRHKVLLFAVVCFVLSLLMSIAHAQNQCQVGNQWFCGDRNIPGTFRCDTEGPCLAVCYVYTCPGPPECPTCNAKAGKPIDLLTGDTFITETDIRLPGLGGGLTLARTWNSIPFTSRASLGMFGPHWTSTFEESVFVDTDYYVKYLRGDGSAWSFLYSGSSGGNYLFSSGGPASEAGQLTTGATTQSSTNWTLTFQNGETRTFDGTTGKMLSIVDRNGNTTQFTYDASYRLVTVTDPAAARHLYFHYSGSSPYIVTSVSSDFGVSLTYTYDTQSRLSQVTEPDNSTLSFQYDSESHITAVLDGNGKVLESHTYNGCGQGLTSARAGGAEAVTVSYSQSCNQPMPRLAFDPLRGQYPKF